VVRKSYRLILDTSSFKNVRSLGPLHTSGPIAFTPDGTRIVTCVGEYILLTDLESGAEICKFVGVSIKLVV